MFSRSGVQGERWLREKNKEGESARSVLDLVEKGLDDVVWTLEVALWEGLCDPFLVGGWNVHHVVAGCYDLGLVGRVLDVVLDMFELGL